MSQGSSHVFQVLTLKKDSLCSINILFTEMRIGFDRLNLSVLSMEGLDRRKRGLWEAKGSKMRQEDLEEKLC